MPLTLSEVERILKTPTHLEKQIAVIALQLGGGQSKTLNDYLVRNNANESE